MKKIFVFFLIGVILIVALGFGFFVLIEKASKESKRAGNVFIIQGIGFKKEAWLEYKIEGYGWEIGGNETKPIVGKILVKLIELPIKEKWYFGVEIDGKENPAIEGIIYATLFDRETGEQSYYLMKLMKEKNMLTFCQKTLLPSIGGLPHTEYTKENFEKEYKVNLGDWKFIGEEEIIIGQPEKKIKVFKFKKEINGLIQEIWLSGEVPTYFVFYMETEGGMSRSFVLTNFGMDGGLPNFTDENLKACEKESFLPLEKQKMFCLTDGDCACGVDKETGECAFGNKVYIDTSKQCPDFCTGIGGNLRVKCINNSCKIVNVK